MYKLVILDLDGTLLTSKKEISNYTENIIKKLKNKVKIVLASARGFSSIKPYIKQLDLLDENNYTIAFNGSLMLNNLEDEIINKEIGFNEKKEIKQYIEKNNQVQWYCYTYTEKLKYNDIAPIDKFLENNKIYKFVCIADEEKILNIRNNLPKSMIDFFQITSSESNRIEFVKKGIKKIEAIKVLLNKLNINPSEVIAIGDGENDIDMIKFAGCGVAMGNATKEVKSIADIVTDTNDNDGVGKILEQLIK